MASSPPATVLVYSSNKEVLGAGYRSAAGAFFYRADTLAMTTNEREMEDFVYAKDAHAQRHVYESDTAASLDDVLLEAVLLDDFDDYLRGAGFVRTGDPSVGAPC